MAKGRAKKDVKYKEFECAWCLRVRKIPIPDPTAGTVDDIARSCGWLLNLVVSDTKIHWCPACHGKKPSYWSSRKPHQSSMMVLYQARRKTAEVGTQQELFDVPCEQSSDSS
jgi:hypothetical protein